MQQIWKYSSIIILNISSIYYKIISPYCNKAIFYLIVFLSIHTFSLATTDVEQLQKLVASDRGASDAFGWSVSISGDYAIVGSRLDDKDASGLNPFADAGSAYIFIRNGNTWTLQQKIVASDRAASDNFGVSVSISGDYAIVGAIYEDEDAVGGNTLGGAGSAYIFVRSGTTWTQQQKIVNNDREGNDQFGISVSISGAYAIVGAWDEDEDASGGNTLSAAGSAYIFVRSGTTWTEQQKLVATDRGAGDNFGLSVSISGDYAIVGSWKDDEDASGGNTLLDAGSAYIFVRNGTTWVMQQKIVASHRAANNLFGYNVSISGDYVIVGAVQEQEDANGGNPLGGAGTAYIFVRNGTTWTLQQKLVASDRGVGDQFGYNVSISEAYAIVSAATDDEDANGGNSLADAGSAYIFKRNGTTWTQQQKIVASDRGAGDNFGHIVSISGDYVIVGSYLEDEDASGGNSLADAGSVYIFQITETNTTYGISLDGNQDGVLDSTQDHVHTFYDPTGTKLITIVDLNNNVLSEVSSSYSTESAYTYPYGLINFKIQASQTQVKIIFHGTSSLTGYEYRKLFADNRFRNYTNAVFGSEVIAGNTVATVTLTLVDGGIGDSDGIVNGIITDPGGPAISSTNIPTLSEWARIILISLLVILGIWKIRKISLA